MDNEFYVIAVTNYSTQLMQYDSRTGRWFSINPLGQFASPYAVVVIIQTGTRVNNEVKYFEDCTKEEVIPNVSFSDIEK